MLETNPSPASHIVIDEWQVWNVGCCVQFRTAFILLKGQSCIWIILVYALISDEFCQKLKNGFSAQQIGFLRVAHIMAHTKQFTIVESEAIECYLISGLFIWFLTSFSSSFPLFWWIPYELFWINKSHWSFSFWQFSKNSCKNWSNPAVWFSEISVIWKHQFSRWYLTGKPIWFNHLISSTTI